MFTPNPRWTYDVFLSFRGEDTRKNFTDHLYTSLTDSEIFTFRDDEELPRGKEISTELIKAIQTSKIAVIVFSKGYASSSWCLDELVEIVKCMNNLGQLVLPIFYDVDPSDVSMQSGCYGDAFIEHQRSFSVDKTGRWREALKVVADLSGWDLQSMSHGYESRFIRKIVQEVSRKLNRKYLSDAIHPVGIHEKVNRIIELLNNVGSSGVRIVGIHGMGGIGKTTLAKAIFNRLYADFEWSCILLNIKDIAAQPNGLVQLQEQLLRDTVKSKNSFRVNNVDRGINLIKDRLTGKRVFVVFDDVENFEQLNALVVDRKLFGEGSKIIVTTRDKHILSQLEEDEKYEVAELDHDRSHELFTWHAFKGNHPMGDYIELVAEVIEYVGGVPLALEVLGSYLWKREASEWRDAINNLKKIPYHEIQKKLRLSFDTLNDQNVEDIFLDIAFFFIGMDKELVGKILNDFGFSIGFSVLQQRSLVKVDDENKLWMHDLIRDMGREIIREKAPKHPEQRNRIWKPEDVFDVLKNRMGTNYIEGITLDVHAPTELLLSTESFKNMYHLRLLKLNGAHLSGHFQYLSKKLKWLCWHRFSLKCIPVEFQLDDLVVLDMQFSNIKELWKGNKSLGNLKIVNLSHSQQLVRTPNFAGALSLERLILEGCTSLVEVHRSIGCLERLVFLNLESCVKLRNLPDDICNLRSLQTLNISNCFKLEKLPEEFGRLEALNELLADGIAIKKLPSSFGWLKNLKTLSLAGLKRDSPSTSWFSSLISSWLPPSGSNTKALLPASFTDLSSLKKLVLRDCGLSDGALPFNLGNLASLNELDLSGNNFVNLPASISHLGNLQRLRLDSCPNLQSILDLPSRLQQLITSDCLSMERLSFQSKEMVHLVVSNCHKLVQIQGVEYLEQGITIGLEGCYNLDKHFKKILLQLLFTGTLPGFCYPGSELPECFSYKGDGSSISFHVPPTLDSDSPVKLIACCIYVRTDRNPSVRTPFITIKNKSTGYETMCGQMIMPTNAIGRDHIGVKHISYSSLPSPMEAGIELVLSIRTSGTGIIVKKCGVQVIVNEADVKELSSPYDQNLNRSVKIEELENVGVKRVHCNGEASGSQDLPSEKSVSKRQKMDPEP